MGRLRQGPERKSKGLVTLGLPWAQEKTKDVREYLTNFLLILQSFPPQDRKETEEIPYAQEIYKFPECRKERRSLKTEVTNEDPILLTASLRKLFGSMQIEKVGRTNIV